MGKLKLILQNFIIGLIGWCLLHSGINDIISPFFLAFLFAVLYISDDIFRFSIGLMLARMVYSFSWNGLAVSLNIVLAVVILWVVKKKVKKRLNVGWFCVVVILASVVDILFCLGEVQLFVLKIINCLLACVFMYGYILFFRAVRKRGVNTPFVLDELLGLGLLIAPIALAGARLQFLGISVSQVIVPLGIVSVALFYGGQESILFAVGCGVGVSFYDLDLSFMAVWVLFSITASSLRRVGRIAMAVAVIILDMLAGFYFGVYGGYTWINVFSLGCGLLLFVCIPRKVIKYIKNFVYNKYEEVCLNEIVVQEEQGVRERLKKMSGLFFNMHNIYKNMVIGNLDGGQIEESLLQEIISKNCVGCPKYKTCHDGKGIAYRSIRELVRKGVSKNKVSLVDAPTVFTHICVKTNQIIFCLNLRLAEYLNYLQEVKKEDDSKILMSNQLLGVSEIISEFSTDFLFGERESLEKEEALIESFLYSDIIVKECAIFKDEQGFRLASVVIKNINYPKGEVLKVANAFFGVKTEISSVKYTKVAGWQIVVIISSARYAYMAGVARVSKQKKSGDTYSELKIDNSRVMFSISDGKGSGAQANRISSMTLGLIEDFYNAGFSSSVIMENVNKVMAYKSGENFCAIDVCVMDLNEGGCDLIKRGGTPTLIKRGNQVQIIEGADLPIGVSETADSHIKRYYLNSGDIVIIASDGVFDAFGDSHNFGGVVNNLPAVNMKEFANSILSEAIKLNRGKILDDMTVLVVKMILNR